MEETLQACLSNGLDCRPLVSVGLYILSWRDSDIAQHAGVNVKTCLQDLGIIENTAKSVAIMSCDYSLMLEKACPLIETRAEAETQISKSLDPLKTDDVVMSRLRRVKSHGQAFTGLTKYQKLFSSTLDAINRYSYDFKVVDDGFHLVSSAVMPWTNQSILMHRETFLTKIIPLARTIKTRRL